MSFKVKDFYKNVLAEFGTEDELITYVSESATTSSATLGEGSLLQYFQYDVDLHERFLSSGSYEEDNLLELIRVTYTPEQEEDEAEE